jgi:hypothetical protein
MRIVLRIKNLLAWCFATLPRRIVSGFIIFSIIFSPIWYFVLRPQSAEGATFNSSQAGDWNVGATWGGVCESSCVAGTDYPGQNDTAIIGTGEVTLTGTQSVYDITISGGTLTMGSNTLTVYRNWTFTSGSFNEDAGTVIFRAGTINIDMSEDFYNVIKQTTSATAITSGDTIIINGSLTLTDGSFNTGSIETMANIDQASTFDGGSATITLGGTGLQTYTMNGGIGPNLLLNSTDITSDTFVLNADSSIGSLTISSDFNDKMDCTDNGYTFNIYGDFTVGAGGTYTPCATVAFVGGADRTADVDSSFTFNNLTINKARSWPWYQDAVIIPSDDTLVITGTLTLNDGTVNTGTMEARGRC